VTDDVLTPAQRRFFDAYEAAAHGQRTQVAAEFGYTPASACVTAVRLRRRLREAGLLQARPQSVLSPEQEAFLAAYEDADYGVRAQVAEGFGYTSASAYVLASRFRRRLQEAGLPAPPRRLAKRRNEAFLTAYELVADLDQDSRADARRQLCERRGIKHRSGQTLVGKVRRQLRAGRAAQAARPAPARSRAA
jgi:phage terminase small subunit